ncbi:hypothetical protein [Hymenobacter busanensis]|uniref:hypothetical protein n=1 Tax=Hymenobacter busanensis TaxID=2607656 RepID=UPI00191C3410|nr:hypothetical protein [Hymenobacter busanensis]
MKHVAKLLNKLAGAAVIAAALSGCGRSEYAMLPKTSPYHGDVHRSVAVQQPAQAPAETPAPVAAEAPVATAPAAPVAAATPATASTASAAKVEAPAPARKLNVVQKLALNNVLKKADKLAAKAQIRQHHNAASASDAQALNHYVKLGLILLIAGVLLGIFGGVIGLLGYILAIIGVVLLILGLLEEV